MDESNPHRTRWVELYGGPYDGLMDEMPWSFTPGDPKMFIAVRGPDVFRGDDTFTLGPLEGYYETSFWLDEELGIIRMDWRPHRDKRQLSDAA